MSIKATALDLDVAQGTDWDLELDFQNTDGSPMDLTGYTFQAQIRSSASSPIRLASITCTIGTPATGGVLTLSMARAVTSALPIQSSPNAVKTITKYAWDLIGTSPSNKIDRYLEGVVNVSPEVVA